MAELKFFEPQLISLRDRGLDERWVQDRLTGGTRSHHAVTGASCSRDAATVLPSADLLCEELAHVVRCDSAILDGEIVCVWTLTADPTSTKRCSAPIGRTSSRSTSSS